jgi:hypothetical protein
MKAGSPLPPLQVPATCPYPEPDQSIHALPHQKKKNLNSNK